MQAQAHEHLTLEPARHFLDILFRGVPGLLEVRAIQPDGPARSGFSEKPEEAAYPLREYADAGLNVYCGLATRKDSSSGAKHNLAATRCIWVDLDFKHDGHETELEKALSTFPLAPSLVVNSGYGRHLYWVLAEPYSLEDEASIRRFEHVLKGLADVLGGDRAATDASRIMRVPGTTNYPNKKKREKGRVAVETSIVSVRPRV